MNVQWTEKALSDLTRLYEFLAILNKPVAISIVQSLTVASGNLGGNPRIGRRLEEFDPREIRRIFVGRYELRYEMVESTIFVLRLWHTREDR